MYLSGVFDRFPRLAVILAHSGGTLPFLAGRLESCIQHDAHYNRAANIRKGIWQVLKENILLDAVVYSEVGLRAAIDASGIDRMLFGMLDSVMIFTSSDLYQARITHSSPPLTTRKNGIA